MKKIIYIFLIAVCNLAYAQKPSIGFVYPSGAKQGQTIEVEVGGQNISRCTEAIITGKGVRAELIIDNSAEAVRRNKVSKKNIGDEDNLQIAQRMKVRITIDKNAELGLKDLRLVSPKGVSNRLFFEVGQLDNFLEKENNSEIEKANVIPSLPCTICGQIRMSDKDYYAVTLQKGHDYVFAVKAREFMPYIADAVPGWFQPTLALYNDKFSEVSYSDDYYFNVNPLIIYTPQTTGVYYLEIKDALYRGREDFMYRIDAGELPYITRMTPFGGNAGDDTEVTLTGVNLPRTRITVSPATKQMGKMPVHVVNNGLVSNDVFFDYSAPKMQERTCTRFNRPVEIELGEVINAHFSKPYEQHIYELYVEKKTKIVFDVHARRYGFPTDAKIDIYRNGKKIFTEDDTEDDTEPMMTHFADPAWSRPLEPGTYQIRVTEAQSKYGDEYQYRLYVHRFMPDFELIADPSIISVPRGGSQIVNLQAIRRFSYQGEISTYFKGLPKGIEVAYSKLLKGEKKRSFTLTAPISAKEGDYVVRLFGEAKQGKAVVTKEAHPAESMMQAFYYTHLLPTSEMKVQIVEPQPFSLKIVNENEIDFKPGHAVPIRVKITRRDDYAEPIQISVKGARNRGSMECDAVTVDKGTKEVTLNLVINRWKKNGLQSIIVQGTVKANGKKINGKLGNKLINSSVTAYAPSIVIQMPDYASPKKKDQK